MRQDPIQQNRHVNLRMVMRELTFDGLSGRQAKARALHVPRQRLDRMLAGDLIPEELAREVEWLLQKHAGWMDEDGKRREL